MNKSRNQLIILETNSTHTQFLYSNTNRDQLIILNLLWMRRVQCPIPVEIAAESVCVAVWCNVVQCGAVCYNGCSVLRCVAVVTVCCSMLRYPRENCRVCLSASLSTHTPPTQRVGCQKATTPCSPPFMSIPLLPSPPSHSLHLFI